MLSSIWNWIFTSPHETEARQLLLTKCIHNRYLNRKGAIIKIQRFIREVNTRYCQEEDLYVTISRCVIKNRHRHYLV